MNETSTAVVIPPEDSRALAQAYLLVRAYEADSNIERINAAVAAEERGEARDLSPWNSPSPDLARAQKSFSDLLVEVAERTRTNVFRLQSEVPAFAKVERWAYPVRTDMGGNPIELRWLERSKYEPWDSADGTHQAAYYVLPHEGRLMAHPFAA